MVSTGVVRRIDDLGRIVIPKEIRRTLGIRDGENLEIFIENDNIKLKKNNIINNYTKEIENIIASAQEIISGEIVITDREKVISSNDVVNKGAALSIGLINLIDERLSICDSKIEEFQIGEKVLTGYFLIIPIISDGSSIGLIIVYNQEKQVTDYYLVVKFISILLARKTNISC